MGCDSSPAPSGRELYVVDVVGTGVALVEADTAAEAALRVSRGCSVGQMRTGANVNVWKVGNPDARFLVRYERPNAEAPPGRDERLGGDYGRVVCLDEEHR